ncbi:NAD(P)H-hydrate repair Nnr-like enzyme with NAD(P)H-hydrate dehydratase domain [Okibacterium sp. HSC-33S16]|uniref:ADP-dependent NAD(P)H-hydrate dehydratase n=1 Tax=Okibacterium sp. HSC-33S16 TaxID=2910965 RepID=UPI0020A010E1|nr:ADP/ATP-dependent (S)-NAD(P)H-hydrate dehydratase [Okibacterium sp. HSC-33S16]MCP2031744.1 NAD(P)H-hydrate repair Nnr-like enzyme with NAD(P)H-hydrate dehydratase domain [Okibacterium sp. HSC-33S16]
MGREWMPWGEREAAAYVAVPTDTDDKYSRGVLGIVTGSAEYPGAGVLGVEGAARTGLGMIRYLGDATDLVLARRPEVVTLPGRVQAWLIGSGTDSSDLGLLGTLFSDALASDEPVVADGGALEMVADAPRAGVLVTPHYRELARMLGHAGEAVSAETIATAPSVWAGRAADLLRVTVLLKGSTTFIAEPLGVRLAVTGAPPWTATAGSGDVLGGVLGALVATHADEVFEHGVLARLAASASVLHGVAASLASRGGPLVALDIAEALPDAVRRLLSLPSR